MTEHEFTYSIIGRTDRCSAARADLPWGHAIRIVRRNEHGDVFGRVRWLCHPELDDYDFFLAMSTAELIEFAKERLRSVE